MKKNGVTKIAQEKNIFEYSDDVSEGPFTRTIFMVILGAFFRQRKSHQNRSEV